MTTSHIPSTRAQVRRSRVAHQRALVALAAATAMTVLSALSATLSGIPSTGF